MLKNKFPIRRIFLFAILFAISITYSYYKNTQIYYYDSVYYWTSADNVLLNDSFNILNYSMIFRGYLFPFITMLFKQMCAGKAWGWRIPSSFCISITFSFFLPYLFNKKGKPTISDCLRIIAAFSFFLLIWGDFMQYPLSDSMAAVFAISGIAIIKYCKESPVTLLNILKFSFAGSLLYSAYNTRAAYLYCVLTILVIFVLCFRKNIKALISFSLALMFGMAIVAIPQCKINQANFGTFSPKVYTEAINESGDTNLQTTQVLWGLLGDRYETYIGEADTYPSTGFWLDDPVGQKIIQQENIDINDFHITEIFRLLTRYPLDICGIYTRHLINLLTPLYPEAYLTNVFTDKSFLIIASIIIWMIAALSLFERISHKQKFDEIIWIFPILIPSFLQLFGAPELRFFIAIYIVTYIYVFLVIDYSNLLKYIKENSLPVLICLTIIFLLWITILGDSLANNRDTTLLIHDRIFTP